MYQSHIVASYSTSIFDRKVYRPHNFLALAQYPLCEQLDRSWQSGYVNEHRKDWEDKSVSLFHLHEISEVTVVLKCKAIGLHGH